MHLETLGELVNWSATFHQGMADKLNALAPQANPRGELLAEYLAGHESQLADTIAALQHTEKNKALDTWVTEFLNNQPLPSLDAPWPKDNAEDLLEEVLAAHNTLLELYQGLLSRCATTPGEPLLTQLIDVEKQELTRIAQAANRMQDI